jgi:hypothetical protein
MLPPPRLKSRLQLEGPTRSGTIHHAHLCQIHLDCSEQQVQLNSRSGGTRPGTKALRRYLLAALPVSLASFFRKATCVRKQQNSRAFRSEIRSTCADDKLEQHSFSYVFHLLFRIPHALDRLFCVVLDCAFSTRYPTMHKSCPYEKEIPSTTNSAYRMKGGKG